MYQESLVTWAEGKSAFISPWFYTAEDNQSQALGSVPICGSAHGRQPSNIYTLKSQPVLSSFNPPTLGLLTNNRAELTCQSQLPSRRALDEGVALSPSIPIKPLGQCALRLSYSPVFSQRETALTSAVHAVLCSAQSDGSVINWKVMD